nr:DNA polymerase III subunit beta [Myxococcota bacterium]
VLAELITLTSYSMSHDDTRPHLAGALFETNGRVARMVTTDGHRLSKAEVAIGDVQSASPLEILIPHRGVAELKKLVDEARADAKATKSAGGEASARPTIDVTAANGTAFFRRDDTNAHVVLSVKLVDERFPPYSKVIPAGATKRVVCGRESLMAALKRVSLLSNDKSGGVHLKLAGGSKAKGASEEGAREGVGTLALGSNNPDRGEGVEEIDVDYVGESLEIGFNAKYLLETLGAMTCDEVALELSKELDPGVIRQAGDGTNDGVDFVGVVMPMRI